MHPCDALVSAATSAVAAWRLPPLKKGWPVTTSSMGCAVGVADPGVGAGETNLGGGGLTEGATAAWGNSGIL